MPLQTSSTRKEVRHGLLFNRVMACIALANLGLVFFDLSYVPWHDFYFRHFPKITQLYDPIKGIEPHRETEKYLQTVQALEAQVAATGLSSPQTGKLLDTLRGQSIDMINQNPFAIANKSGTLEKIKDQMRRRLPNPEDSSKQAFSQFWSVEHLNQGRWDSEIQWFNGTVKPLIASNYYRSIGENGEFTDRFWQIDLPFMALFGLEFLARTWFLSRRYAGLAWHEAMIWRWYDIFLFIPVWRVLRVIPVTVRVNQGKLPDLEPLRAVISRLFFGSVAQELTEVVVVQVIDQMQGAIRSGDLAKQLFKGTKQRYVDLNEVNEIEAIATRLVQVTIYNVIPQLQPDLEALIRHSLETTLKQSPVYQGLNQVPGLGNFPEKLAEQLVSELSKLFVTGPQNTYEVIKAMADDPVGTQLANQLVQHFGQKLGAELQQKQTLQEIERLLAEFLEEIKINYVQQVTQEESEKILAQTKQQSSLPPR